MSILSDEHDEGQRRVYFTRAASVVSYFTDDGEGGVRANVIPGEFACPWSTTQEKLDAVAAEMLGEAARRLHCRPDQVQLMSMEDIARVADPPLKVRHSWVVRVKVRSRGGR